MQETRPQTRQIQLRPNAAAGSLSSSLAGAMPASGSVFFIGNATVLLRFGGFTILTDPTYTFEI